MSGSWSGTLSFTMHRLPTVRATISTTVRVLSTGDVLHTTLVEKAGMSLFRSVETILLGQDGRSFTLQSEQRTAPFPWIVRVCDGDGEVTEAADGATYRMGWLGTTLHQRTRVVPEGLAVQQQSAWSRGSTVLRRLP